MRTTQHRPQRESDAREKAELKRENRALRKQNARLRRQVQKLVEAQGVVGHEAQDLAPRLEAKLPGCDACGSRNLARIVVSSGVLIACKECKHRKKELKP